MPHSNYQKPLLQQWEEIAPIYLQIKKSQHSPNIDENSALVKKYGGGSFIGGDELSMAIAKDIYFNDAPLPQWVH